MILTKPQRYIANSPRAINLFLAGMGSGKTYLAGILSADMIINHPNVKGFIAANTYDQLNTSTLYRIKAVWDEVLGLKEGVHYVAGNKPHDKWIKAGHYFDSYNNIISFANGGVIFQGSLENAKSHEGKEFGWAILDETKDTREEDVKEVVLMRLREKGLEVNGRSWNPLFILTSPAKVPWINEWFKLDEREGDIKKHIYSETDYFKDEYENKRIAISSTYHNLLNLPPNYIESKKYDLSTEQFNRMIYGDPFMKTGGEFYASFDRSVHVGQCEVMPGEAIHISFDQNVVPYITANVYQIKEIDGIYNVYAIDEFCLPNPNNKTEKLCERIVVSYDELMQTGGLYYYGDASGKHRDTRGMENDYDIIRRMLSKYISNTSDRVNGRNPGLNKRRMFINRIFENKLPIRMLIDPRCKNLITDLEYIKETPEGTKFKQTARDEKQGVSYEKYGHCFTGDTIIDGMNKIKNVKIGDITEFGKVLNVWDNGIREIKTYKIGDVKIKCTPDHKILVLSDSIDYICIDNLTNSNQNVLLKQGNQWKKKQLFIKDLNSIAIQMLKDWQIKDISAVTLKSMASGLRNVFMSLFGNGIAVRFYPAIIFIILMGILTIIQLIIWNVLKVQNILVNMVKMLRMKSKHFALKFYEIMSLRQDYGMDYRMAMNGISNNSVNLSAQMKLEYVKNVGLNIKKELKDQCFAAQDARTDIQQECQESGIHQKKLQYVKFVEQNLNHFQRMLVDFAVKNVIKNRDHVYDLEIENNHVYNANGILVHNCSDDLDYFLCSAFEGYM